MEKYEVLVSETRELPKEPVGTMPIKKDYWKEGLNPLYKLSAFTVLALLNKNESTKLRRAATMLRKVIVTYETILRGLSKKPYCLSYQEIVNYGFMKKKHWMYAAYMSLISSLPLLYKLCKEDDILRAIIAKTSFGAGVKLLDNLNDYCHSVEDAIYSLKNLLSAYISGLYEPKVNGNNKIISMAENSALDMSTWIYKILDALRLKNKIGLTFDWYVNDSKKLIMGQIESLLHKKEHNETLTMKRYIEKIIEKSIGDVWIDIDLCFMESAMEDHLTNKLINSLILLKSGISMVFKATILYDDIVDIYEDVRSNSINSMLLLSIERGLIKQNALKYINLKELVSFLISSGILRDIVKLGDVIHITGIELIRKSIDKGLEDIIDENAIIDFCNVMRLFVVRKFLIREKDVPLAWHFVKFPKNNIELPDDLEEVWKNYQKHLISVPI
ncbi:MAG: hypothetical protein RMJ14_00655 [Nitrososphaerota archaeon]|nr:hypothetical protein [Aigarchaeota archaeon]MDW8076138.1 hypothetical protein [Nitrososphaerota archaeon]